MKEMLESMLLELNQAKKIVVYGKVSGEACYYTENVINNAKFKVTILFYWANWCAVNLNGELKTQPVPTSMLGFRFMCDEFVFVPNGVKND